MNPDTDGNKMQENGQGFFDNLSRNLHRQDEISSDKAKDDSPGANHVAIRRIMSLPQRDSPPPPEKAFLSQQSTLSPILETTMYSSKQTEEHPLADGNNLKNAILLGTEKDDHVVKLKLSNNPSSGDSQSKKRRNYWSSPLLRIFGKTACRRNCVTPCVSAFCPPIVRQIFRRLYTTFGFWLTFVVFFWLVFTSLYSISTDAAFPPKCRYIKSLSTSEKPFIFCEHGEAITVLFLYIVAFAFGEIVEIIRLPGLLGMLLSGLLIRLTGTVILGETELILGSVNSTDLGAVEYSPAIRFAAMCRLESHLSSLLRRLALATILTRAGFSLDPQALKEGCSSVFRLALMPCFGESLSATIASRFIIGWNWSWGALLGFVLAAVSPAVIVPNMLRLELDGWGVDKGIPTLVMAASSMDDVISIMGFGVAFSISFTGGTNIAANVLKGIGEAIGGAVIGAIIGVCFWILPPPGLEHCHTLRVMLTILTSITFLVGAERVDVSGAGALACLCFSFTVAGGWRAGYPWKLVTLPTGNTSNPTMPSTPVPDSQAKTCKKQDVTRSQSLPMKRLTSPRDSETPIDYSDTNQQNLDQAQAAPKTGRRSLRLAYSVLPPHMRHSLKREESVNLGQGGSPFSFRQYLPIGPRTRRFSLPEPRAHYDSEDFMKKTVWSKKLRLGSQQHALHTMKSPMQIMNSVVGIDTKNGRGTAWRYKMDSESSLQGANFHSPIPEVDSNSSDEADPCTRLSSSSNLKCDPVINEEVPNEDSKNIEVFSDTESIEDNPDNETGQNEEHCEDYFFVTPTDRGLACLKSIRMVYAALWWFLQPMLFVLIGSEVNVKDIFNDEIGSSVFVLVIALMVRLVFSVMAVTPSKLLLRERLFVAIAWLPKATVQAAIGSEAFDRARQLNENKPELVKWGQQVLSLAVLSILITAPLGAILIPLTAPRLLKHTPRTFDISTEAGNSINQSSQPRNKRQISITPNSSGTNLQRNGH